MIRNLQRKFILAAMCAIVIVLEGIIVTVNVVNGVQTVRREDEMTSLIVYNGGTLDQPGSEGRDGAGTDDGGTAAEPPEKPNEEKTAAEESGTGNADDEKTDAGKTDTGKADTDKSDKTDADIPSDVPQISHFTEETPYQTRYFTVTADADGTLTDCNLERIASVTEEEAEEYAASALENSETTGYEGIYRYRISREGDTTLLIFLDCSQDLGTVETFAKTSFGISLIGLAAVFVLIVVFSRLVFRPVAASYAKQKQFITDASHELKTPLTIIDANTEVLEMEHGESRWTASIRNQVRRLSLMTGQLITLARLEEEKTLREGSPFSLSELLIETVEPFEVPAENANKTLVLQVEENVELFGEEKSIRQLLEILLDNALKYSLSDTSIEISLKRRGQRKVLTIYNQSEEIPKGSLDQIFERFYRLDAARSSTQGGSGIGLSVAKAVVDAHRGKISAVSEDGHSLTIEVVFS